MDYINSLVDYLKSIFSNYVFNFNRDSRDIDDSISTIENVKILDTKIGNIDEVLNILNEISPKIMTNIKKNHKFNKKLLLNPSEINYIIKWIELYQKEKPEPLLETYTVDDVIFNTHISFLYNKMILIKQRYDIIEEYSNKT
jgi:hypothetical protein